MKYLYYDYTATTVYTTAASSANSRMICPLFDDAAAVEKAGAGKAMALYYDGDLIVTEPNKVPSNQSVLGYGGDRGSVSLLPTAVSAHAWRPGPEFDGTKTTPLWVSMNQESMIGQSSPPLATASYWEARKHALQYQGVGFWVLGVPGVTVGITVEGDSICAHAYGDKPASGGDLNVSHESLVRVVSDDPYTVGLTEVAILPVVGGELQEPDGNFLHTYGDLLEFHFVDRDVTPTSETGGVSIFDFADTGEAAPEAEATKYAYSYRTVVLNTRPSGARILIEQDPKITNQPRDDD